MTKPFPCCGCSDGCTDYGSTWRFDLTSSFAAVANGYANRANTGLGMYFWSSGNGIASGLSSAFPLTGWSVGSVIIVDTRVQRRVYKTTLGLSYTSSYYWKANNLGGTFSTPEANYDAYSITLSNFRIILSIYEEYVTGTSPTTTKKTRYVDAQIVWDVSSSGIAFTTSTTPEDTSETNHMQLGMSTASSGSRVKYTNCSLPFVLADGISGKGNHGGVVTSGMSGIGGGITIPARFSGNIATINH